MNRPNAPRRDTGRLWILPALLLTLALLGAACSGSGDQSDATADSQDGGDDSSSAQEGGSLTVLVASPMESWDPATLPHTIPGLHADRFNAVYGTLVYVGPEGEVQMGMAESLTTEDNQTWTLTLRDGIQFTNGNQLDAEAVKYNWDRIADPETGAVAQPFASTFETEVVDELTLEIALDEPDPTFAQRVAEQIPFIAAPQSLEEQGDQYTDPVGAGPFTLESQEAGVSETVVANPDYWEEDRPRLDQITFRSVSDPAQRVSTVVQGGAHYMNGYYFQFAEEAEQPGVSTYDVPAGGLRHFVFNTASAPFDDVRARRAISLAVDPTEMVRTLTQLPDAEGSTALFPEDSPYLASEETLPSPDLEQAQQIVDELTADGGPLEFTIVAAGVPELDRSAQLLQTQVNQLDGVNASVETIAIADWRQATYEQDQFDVTFYPGVFDLNPPAVSMSNLLGTGGAANFANFSNDEMDQALSTARQASLEGGDELESALAEVQRIYTEQVPLMVFGVDYRAFFHQESVAGFTPMGRGSLLMKELYLTDSE